MKKEKHKLLRGQPRGGRKNPNCSRTKLPAQSHRFSMGMKSASCIAIGIVFFFFLSCSKNTITISSLVLRNRVVVLDNVVMKKALYVAFSLLGYQQEVRKFRIK